MINYKEIEYGEEGMIKIYDSYKPYRLTKQETGVDDETFLEYKVRQKAIKIYTKKRGKKIHISSMLIPLMTKEGNIILDKEGKPIWVGKTKGTTYKKDELKKEHLNLVEHLKSKIDEQEESESKS